MITATLEKVSGGYLLNGSFVLADPPETEESRAAIAHAAKMLADDIDRRCLEEALKELGLT